MANKLIRFGRPQDRPSLLNEIAVLGHRQVTEVSRNAMLPHMNKRFEITYVVSGTLEWLINDELIVTRQNDILVTFPEDKLALLGGHFMVSDAYFMQIDLDYDGFMSESERELFNRKLHAIEGRKISLPTDRSILFSKLISEHERQDVFSEGLCKGWLHEILTMVVRRSEGWEAKTYLNEYNLFKKSLLSYLETHVSRTDIKVQEIAEHFNYSESHFRFLFKKIFKTSPVDFVRQFRVDTAQRLIREGSLSITEIAYKVGFSSSQYFSQTFKKELGMSPREYRKSLRLDSGRIQDMTTSIYFMDQHFPDKK
ncbi:L-rhamnose operon transcriptional activator [Lentisphaera araneosa HTCC2155]|uniref:L-rhamnose operon transcriptional activator n=1 Tax=Lentisphaera araneosa HTCC2155 TaxID=313628 RepID=A6DPG8_9BACT|nr:helix-turn-helix domain-containing protein [Lentisphaera araneosa]EDM26464.1 L-rhamnose operon transcriptional activator [Lentisphaera araneosa HTCC2155]